MNAKELKIEAPEGYEVDWDNSSKDTIRFKPIEKKVTYANIIKNLYSRGCYYINNNPTSTKQLEQLLALNKLMNVAKYLNGNWKINWRSKQEKYYIVYDHWNYVLTVTCSNYFQSTLVYFESLSLAKQAIEILGEEEVKKALGIFE